MVNGFFKLIDVHPFDLPDLDFLMKKACKQAKLPEGAACEFDMPGESADWKEGFHVYRKAMNTEGGAHAFGAKLIIEITIDKLTIRARQIHAWKKMPELQATPINRPIFIMGNPRTGTTLLFNLLSNVDGMRTTKHWELNSPIPGEGEATGDAHIALAKKKVELKMSLLPGLEHIHLLRVTDPEECIFQMFQSFHSFTPVLIANVSSYIHHIMQRNLTLDHVMRHHRRNLQWLQATAREETPQRWVLKAPHWALMIEDIEKFYPDALFIFTHRAPHKSMGSISSLTAKSRSLFVDRIELEKIGPDMVSVHEEMIDRILDARRRWKGDPNMAGRVYDVHLGDLAKDPIGTAAKVLDHFGMEKLSGESRAAMQMWLDSGKSYAGKHHFDIETFGISKEGILASPVFKRYCKEFSVPEC